MPLPVFGKAHQSGASADFTWFVYGSSLDRSAFAEWATSHGYALPDFSTAVPARLKGFRLAFDVVSRHWGGAVASLSEAQDDFVEGLAIPMPGSARGLVEHKEGVVSGLYTPIVVVLKLPDGEPREALAFRAAPLRRLPADAKPSPAFLEALRRGAQTAGLSREWQERLSRIGG
jgi:hypothetical protein